MTEYKPERGDKVRVVLEGKVEHVGNFTTEDGPDYVLIGDHDIFLSQTVSVEKIEPPVEVFKPGDVVRHKTVSRFTYTIGEDGAFIEHRTGKCFKDQGSFTSANYEKVELPSAH